MEVILKHTSSSKSHAYLERLQEKAYLKKGLTPDAVLKDIQDELKFMQNFIDPFVQNQNTSDNSEDLEKMKNDLKKYLEQTKITPTKYESPYTYSLVMKMIEDIEISAKDLRLVTKDGEKTLEELSLTMKRPLYGTMPFGQVNAMAVPVQGSDEHLVIFDSDLFTHCNLLAKIVSKAIPFKGIKNGMLSFSFTNNDIKKQIENDGEILQRFQELLFAYFVKENPSAAPSYLLKPPYDRITAILRDSMEYFIVGHEMAHILLNHRDGETLTSARIDDMEFKKLVYSWSKELDADTYGLVFMIGAMRMKGYPFSLSIWGADLFFSFQDILERGTCLINSGTEDWHWCGGRENGPLGTHPPAMIRRKKLRELVKNQFGEEVLEPSKGVENIVNILWDKTKGILTH